MAAPSHPHVVTSIPVTSTPQPSPSHADADRENVSLPHTPSSTGATGAFSSRRPSTYVSQHRKASSLSSPQSASKVHTRSRSLRDSQIPSLSSGRAEGGKSESVMVTPPQNLPPSPPLTTEGTDGDGDGDADVDVDLEELVQDQSDQDDDVTERWRDLDSPVGRSTDHDHPLREGFTGDARFDTDLEKGIDAPEPQGRIRSSMEVEMADAEQSGVTKPFEVVRRPKRTTSPKPPHSSYYIGPPTSATAFFTSPCGQIGVHHPREIVRIERDYGHGELVQFSSAYPLELQGRITPTQFLETINALNEGLIRAHSLAGAFFDNTLAFLTLWLSTLVLPSKYDREMRHLQQLVDALNAELYNPQGLNILWPRKSAFLFLEIEYY